MLLFMDGFDHYGADSALLTQGVYASASGVTLSAATPRTGARSARIAGGFETGLRRVFGGDKDVAGVGYAFLIPALPTNSNSVCLATFRDNANVAGVSLYVSSTGQLVLRAGGGPGGPGVVLASSLPVVSAGSYEHFETRIAFGGPGVGTFEARLNGVTVLNATGIDTAGASDELAQVQIGTSGQGVFGFPAFMAVDDLFAWDDEAGSGPDDFVGDKKVYTTLPDADTAVEEWSLSVGVNSFALLNNVPPLDGSEYLFAEDPDVQTVVGLSDLPAEVVTITAVMTAVRAFKTDAGDAKIQVGMISSATEADGTEKPLTQAPRYHHDVFPVDPATAAAWTLAGFNAATLSLDRTE